MTARVRVAAGCLLACATFCLPGDNVTWGRLQVQQQFVSGDVFASITTGVVAVYRRDPVTGLHPFRVDPDTGQNLTDAAFALVTGADTSQATGSAFDRLGNFYVTTFQDGRIFKFPPDFNAEAGDVPTFFVTGGNAPESILFDAAGNMYVGHAHLPNDDIRKFTADGLLLDSFDAEPDRREGGARQGTDWIELAPDQRTMLYTSEGRRIRRYDLVDRVQLLPDFADLEPDDLEQGRQGRLFAMRLLPDGTLLVADNVEIKHLSAAGAIIKRYDFPGHDGWFSLNLDPDGTSFWSGDFNTGQVHKFSIAAGGSPIDSIFTPFQGFLFGVSVFNEPTQATAPRCETPVLELSPVIGSTCGTVRLSARLTCGGNPMAEKSISFALSNSAVGQASTGPDGVASLEIPSPPLPVSSPDGATATFAGDATVAPATDTAELLLTNGVTLVTTDVTGDTCGVVSLSGTLACGTKSVADKTVTFSLNGASVGQATTNDAGVATLAAITPPPTPGSSPGGVEAVFAGDPGLAPATDTADLSLTNGMSLVLTNVTGDTCGTLTLTGALACGPRPVANRPISFALNGSPAGTAFTNDSGVATLPGISPPGTPGAFAGGIAGAFAGDASFAPATDVADLSLTNGTTILVPNVSGSTCETLTLSATLACGTKLVGDRPISFSLDGVTVGSAVTGPAGVATLPNVPSPSVAGTFPGAIAASFAGDAQIAAKSGTADLALTEGCRPALALTKTADPTTYTARGEVITYKYVLTNNGQVSLSSPFTVTDDKLGSFACSTDPSLPVDGSLSCTKPYAIQAGDLGSMATPPLGVPATINTGFWLQGVVSPQDTSISGAAGVVDGVYPGWCIQHGVPLDLHNQPAKLYSSVGVPLPADAAGLPWNQINYVLNHKIRGPGKTDLEFFKDVQTAIWMLLGEASPIFGVSPQARQMVAEARAHQNFVPGPSDVVAVLVYSDGMGTGPGSIQESIIELKPFQSITNHAVATARAGTVTVASNEAQATVRQVLQNTPTGLMDAVATGRQSGMSPTVTTSAFSTSLGNELLLAFISADYYSGPNTTVTGVGGAGLIWELVTRANGQKGTAEIWRAFSYAPLTAVTVTASLSQSVSSSITVVSFKNVDTSGSNGSGAIGAVISKHALTGAPTAALTTTRNNAFVFAVGTDWDNAIARTPAPGQAIVHQYMAPIGDTYWVQRTAGAIPLAGSVVTMKDVAPTNDRWNFAAVEIVPSPIPAALVTVPNVVNRTSDEAGMWLTAAGFGAGTVTHESSATVPEGIVIGQSPGGGTQAWSGSSVALVVSSGADVAKPEVGQVVSSDGSGKRTTRAFSTSTGGQLLLAFAASDGPPNGRQSLTISGGGLSWTLVQRANREAGTSEIWKAYAPAPLSNVTVSSTQRTGGYDQSLTVVTFTGASGIGNSAFTHGSSGAPSAAITTTAAGSLIYAVGNDWDRAVARTLGNRQVMVHEWVDSRVGDTFWVQAADRPSPSAGASVRLNATSPTRDRWNLAIVEIVR